MNDICLDMGKANNNRKIFNEKIRRVCSMKNDEKYGIVLLSKSGSMHVSIKENIPIIKDILKDFILDVK